MVLSYSHLERLASFPEVCHYMNSHSGATTDVRIWDSMYPDICSVYWGEGGGYACMYMKVYSPYIWADIKNV